MLLAGAMGSVFPNTHNTHSISDNYPYATIL